MKMGSCSYYAAFLLLLFVALVGGSASSSNHGGKQQSWQQLKDQMKPLGNELGKTWMLCSELVKNETIQAAKCSGKGIEKGWSVLRTGSSMAFCCTKKRIGKWGQAINNKARSSNLRLEELTAEVKGIAQSGVSANAHLKNVEREVSFLREEVATLKTAHLFAVAIHNAHYNSFQYYDADFDDTNGIGAGDNKRRVYSSAQLPKDSASLVRKTLFAFQQGHSVIIRLASYERIQNQTWDEVKDMFVDFYHQVRDQIHKLTGVKPILEWMDDGRCKFSFPQ